MQFRSYGGIKRNVEVMADKRKLQGKTSHWPNIMVALVLHVPSRVWPSKTQFSFQFKVRLSAALKKSVKESKHLKISGRRSVAFSFYERIFVIIEESLVHRCDVIPFHRTFITSSCLYSS